MRIKRGSTLKLLLENLSAILKPVSLIVQIIAFGVIVLQVIIARQAFEAQAWQLITQQMGEINKTFIEHPDLYPYFYQSEKLEQGDPNENKVILMSDMLLDFMDVFEDDYVRKLAGMENNGEYWIAWENYFKDQFRLSPALCSRYKHVKSWYTENGVIDNFAAKGCIEIKDK